MSIYLAWSLYKVVIVAWLLLLFLFGLWKLAAWQLAPGDPRITKQRNIVKGIGVYLTVMLALAAVNIGDRQQSLTRSSFNATFPEAETVPAYVPPPPDHVKAARDALDKNILELNNSIKERKQ